MEPLNIMMKGFKENMNMVTFDKAKSLRLRWSH